jgi:hypothetical protein
LALSKFAQEVTFVTCISDVPGMNLSQDTSYPNWGSLWLSSVPPGLCQDVTLNQEMAGFFHIISN